MDPVNRHPHPHLSRTVSGSQKNSGREALTDTGKLWIFKMLLHHDNKRPTVLVLMFNRIYWLDCFVTFLGEKSWCNGQRERQDAPHCPLRQDARKLCPSFRDSLVESLPESYLVFLFFLERRQRMTQVAPLFPYNRYHAWPLLSIISHWFQLDLKKQYQHPPCPV